MKQFLFVLTFLPLALPGQTNGLVKPHPWSMAISVGAMRTGLWNQPLQGYPCIEGCGVYKQAPLLAPTFSVAFNYDFNRKHVLVTGVGLDFLRYRQTGFSSDGASYHDYERDYSYSFFNLQLGYRFRFLLNEKSHWFVDNRVVMDMDWFRNKPEFVYMNPVSFSYAGRLGTQWTLASRHALVVSVLFKTALGSYDSEYTDPLINWSSEPTLPFGYGLDCGWVYRL